MRRHSGKLLTPRPSPFAAWAAFVRRAVERFGGVKVGVVPTEDAPPAPQAGHHGENQAPAEALDEVRCLPCHFGGSKTFTLARTASVTLRSSAMSFSSTLKSPP